MNTPVQIKVHPKENFYLAFRVIAALVGYLLFFAMLFGLSQVPDTTPVVMLLAYAGIIGLFILLRMGMLIGYLKGNAVKLSQKQFPDIYTIVKNQSARLNMDVPDVYILQEGGLLNAFATQFFGGKYIVLYSDILEEAYSGNLEAVEFVIGHELGHIKRRHLTKSLLLFPSVIVPFLNRAYSRGCEYTCDNIGAELSPAGANQGLLLLAAGKGLWRKVNRNEFVGQMETESGFWHWFSEKMSTYPHLNKRVNRFQESAPAPRTQRTHVETVTVVEKTTDHSAYLPRN
jgi:Zn-dependent protease with chaperone function